MLLLGSSACFLVGRTVPLELLMVRTVPADHMAQRELLMVLTVRHSHKGRLVLQGLKGKKPTRKNEKQLLLVEDKAVVGFLAGKLTAKQAAFDR